MIRNFIILLFLPFWIMAVDYCSISSDHTMCKYKGPGPACGKERISGISEREIREILKVHNDFRSIVALGKERRGNPGPQPAAANMNALIWDNNLAEVAQRWADQCTFQHDFSRQDPRFQVGQNIYFATGYPKSNWTQAISTWYEEVTEFNSKNVKKFQFQFTTGHYTQLVWGNTRYIGCGKTTYNTPLRAFDYEQKEYILSSIPRNESIRNDDYLIGDNLSSNVQNVLHTRVKKWIGDEWINIYENMGKNHILVCNYGPSGNFLYQPVYISGKHCSQCPFGFQCINGLCI
ncbi:venom allergen 5-like isoform X2 [Leptopilina heterotoma]|uniref:venom allergen 5-like isoform X2 n=1 Tax=Leptopilina heterotoma TaxID=63436 RepID=UPI001CA7C16C|nr:venom allergen 5-like isoform X2 [Leptopilina heterotoma]